MSGFIGSTGSRSGIIGGITVDQSHHVPSSFQARATGQTIEGGNTIPVQFPTVLHNEGSDYNNSTHIYTCPVDGFYLFTCMMRVDILYKTHAYLEFYFDFGSATDLRMMYDNDKVMALTTDQPQNLPILSVVVKMASSDTCKVSAYLAAASETSMSDTTNMSQFSGQLLGLY